AAPGYCCGTQYSGERRGHMGFEIAVQRRAHDFVDDRVNRCEGKIKLVPEHTEHIGHEPEHNLPAAMAIDALGITDIVEEPPEGVIEPPGMLPRVCRGIVCGGLLEGQHGWESLLCAYPALEPAQHGRHDLWRGNPRRTTLQTAVTKQPRTRHGGRQDRHL